MNLMLTLKSALLDHGLKEIEISNHVTGSEIKVLLASRHKLTCGTIRCCDLSEATVPNWLHMQVGRDT